MDVPKHPILDNPNWVSIETPEDPDLLENPELGGDFAVWFSDVVAHDFEDLVLETVPLIARFPGVRRAVHEDREMIAVWGADVDRVALAEAIRSWWLDQLHARGML